MATDCDAAEPSITIANRDGLVTVMLRGDAKLGCRSWHPGQYVEADGEKVNEALFLADSVDVSD